MHRSSATKPATGKATPGSYRVGAFLITRAKSRWHICADHSAPKQHFSTLGGAIAWCRQQSTTPLPQKISRPTARLVFVTTEGRVRAPACLRGQPHSGDGREIRR